MRATKAYYTTSHAAGKPGSWYVQKMSPDLEPVQKPYHVTQLDNGTFICSCVARVSECRHIQIIKKFATEIGKHAPYDFDNDRFYEAAGYLTET